MPKLSLVTCLSLMNFISILPVAQPGLFDAQCPNDSTFTQGSVFQTNLRRAQYDLPTTNSGNGFGFFSTSTGQDPDRVYAIALCRGDVTRTDCNSCVSNIFVELTKPCPNNIDAAGYSDDSKCMVKYSNSEILGNTGVEHNPINGPSDVKVSDAEGFDRAVNKLMGNLKDRAAGEGRLRKYASNSTETSVADYPVVYGTMQCVPSLTEEQCRSCLTDAVRYISSCCSGRIGGRVLFPLCNLRYETNRFFSDALPLPGKNIWRVVIIVLAVTFVIIIASVVTWRYRKKMTTYINMRSGCFQWKTKPGFIEYNFYLVWRATNCFSEENKIGEGEFGSVYKGKLDGQWIAVKRLSSDSRQDDQQFRNNVELVSSLQHENLARLLGFSIDGEERLLIYEFFQNASLDKFLVDPNKRTCLDWDMSYKIIEGVARGLVYLHEDSHQEIIHCDLKASNILLDVNMNPKITDFGMTKLFAFDKTRNNTITIEGTVGYMPPEYVSRQHGQISVKRDVFSFGVLVLEIIKGQMCQSFQSKDSVNLLTFAWNSWQEERSKPEIIDYRLLRESDLLPEISKSIHVALLCVQESEEPRPTMTLVVDMLKGSHIMREPSRPGFYYPYEAHRLSQIPALAA